MVSNGSPDDEAVGLTNGSGGADESAVGGLPDSGEGVASPERVDEIARSLRERDEPFARATVVRREPPVSANVGDRAVITTDGDVYGWIGGVECAQETVVGEARTVVETGSATLVGLAPDPDAIDRPGLDAHRMTCHSGGTLEVFIEAVTPSPQLVVVGDSPIVAALSRLAGELAFEVVVVDRDGGEYPAADAVVTSTDTADVASAVAGRPYVVVASTGAYDAEGVAAAAELDAAYVGLVASDTRAEEVTERAADRLGVSPDAVRSAVTTPAGVDIAAKAPEEIAVSILAEVVDVRQRHRAATELAGDADQGDQGDEGDEADERNRDAAAPDRDDGATAVDPVCEMEVSVEDPPATVDHEGVTYYFCCQACADAFGDDPEQFLVAEAG